MIKDDMPFHTRLWLNLAVAANVFMGNLPLFLGCSVAVAVITSWSFLWPGIAQSSPNPNIVLPVLLIGFVLQTVVGIFVGGVYVYAAAKSRTGGDFSFKGAFDYTLGRLMSLIGVTFIAAFIIGVPVGILFMVIMTVFGTGPESFAGPPRPLLALLMFVFMAATAFIYESVMLCQMGAWKAFLRNLELVKTDWPMVLGVMLIVSVFTNSLNALIPFPDDAIKAGLFSVGVGVFTGPLIAIIKTLMYLYIRTRGEGGTLEEVVAVLDAPPQAVEEVEE